MRLTKFSEIYILYGISETVCSKCLAGVYENNYFLFECLLSLMERLDQVPYFKPFGIGIVCRVETMRTRARQWAP